MNGRLNNMCGSCLKKKAGLKPKYETVKKTVNKDYYAKKKTYKNGKKK